MNRLKRTLGKYALPALTGLVLLVLALAALPMDDAAPEALVLEVRDALGQRQISLWEDGDTLYAFLPAHCSPEQVYFRVLTSRPVTLNGAPVTTGMDLGGLSTQQEHLLTLDGQTKGFRLLLSQQVATLYLDTRSGSMKAIHADKKNQEAVTVTLIDREGKLDYTHSDGTLRGRGNSTWVYEKKPYLLTLPGEASLLGMGAGTKWVLLANAVDETNLRNKVVYDLAADMGMYWSPGCEYVDVYLNGEYAGLYLLSQRVETGPGRLDLGDDPQSFLCKLDLPERLASLKDPFQTELGRAVEINSPRDISGKEKQRIMEKVQLMEDTILSGGDLTQTLDLDSWVRRLLIDEITENLDGDRASSYFYYYNGLFYAGPVWDYDHIWGTRDRNLNPEVVLSQSGHKADGKPIPYQNALYRNPQFYERMLQIYTQEMLPLLEELAQGGITQLAQQIQAATERNSLRWSHMFDYWKRPDMSAGDLEAFLRKRLDFLHEVWLEGKAYYTVQVEIDGDLSYYNFAVEPGASFDPAQAVEVPGIAQPVWYNAETGALHDPTAPVTGDLRLHLTVETLDEVLLERKAGKMVAVYMGLILGGILLAISVEVYFTRGRRRGRGKQ